MLWVELDRTSDVSMTMQLYSGIRDMILNGQLKAGEKLPASRLLAKELGVSRNVIAYAYEQLMAEGYIYGRGGSGTFVGENLHLEKKIALANIDDRQIRDEKKKKPVLDLSGGIPDIELFPVKKWNECYKSVCNCPGRKVFDYPEIGGEEELKDEVRDYLLRSRGITCKSENIFITNGSISNFEIVATLLDSEKKILIEDPVFNVIAGVFRTLNKKLIPVHVDLNGMNLDSIADQKADFVFTTPSHQYPLAVTMSAERRVKLIAYARRNNTCILEDDYDSEFRYAGNRISPLCAMASDSVIYSGTFSKTLSPAFRIAYLVVPDALLQRFSAYFESRLSMVNKIDQLALASFIHKGYLERHLLAKKKSYAEKFAFLKSLLSVHLHDAGIISNDSGLHLVVALNSIVTQFDIDEFTKQGFGIDTVNMHSLNQKTVVDDNRIIIAFSNIKAEELERAIVMIGDYCKRRK